MRTYLEESGDAVVQQSARVSQGVRASNLAARSMYERFGFRVVGERRSYYREPVEDAKIMTRPLAPAA